MLVVVGLHGFEELQEKAQSIYLRQRWKQKLSKAFKNLRFDSQVFRQHKKVARRQSGGW